MFEWGPIRWIAETVNFGVLFAALVGILPAVTAIVGAVYYAIQIYESPTVQKWLKLRQETRVTRRIHRLLRKRKSIMSDLTKLGHTDPKV